MHLTLLVPELLWPEPADQAAWEGLALPGLAWLLGHAPCERQPALPYEHALAAAWGRGADAPLAALRLLGEQAPGALTPGDACWLCADPVHLRFHHERVVLADAGAFELAAQEAVELVAALNREFADLGSFHALTPRRWLLRLARPVAFATPPLSAVAGRRLDRGQAASPLQSVLNEIQMVLHGHPVNEARAARGLPAVNGLWLWGAGALGDAPPAPFACLHADDPLARGLALSAAVQALPLPAGLDALLAAAPAERAIAVLDAPLSAVLYEDSARWRAILAGLDAAWFAPAARALGRLKSLTLLAPTVYGALAWRLEAGARWRFWRRPADLAALARSLAA